MLNDEIEKEKIQLKKKGKKIKLAELIRQTRSLDHETGITLLKVNCKKL
jgi:hypothetical protein